MCHLSQGWMLFCRAQKLAQQQKVTTHCIQEDGHSEDVRYENVKTDIRSEKITHETCVPTSVQFEQPNTKDNHRMGPQANSACMYHSRKHALRLFTHKQKPKPQHTPNMKDFQRTYNMCISTS